MNDRKRLARQLWPRGQLLPDAKQLEDRAWELDLRHGCPAATGRRCPGAIRALEFFRAHDRSGRMDGMLACYFTWHLRHA